MLIRLDKLLFEPTGSSFGGFSGNGTFTNNGGMVSGAGGGSTNFFSGSTATNRTFINNGARVAGAEGGFTSFLDTSTAADGTFSNNGGAVIGAGGGFTVFHDKTTADSATLIADGGTGGGQGGLILFEDNSTGGTSRIELFSNGNLDISVHNPVHGRMAIGSIEGDGNAFLGANNLIVGSNNMSTTFSGVTRMAGRIAALAVR